MSDGRATPDAVPAALASRITAIVILLKASLSNTSSSLDLVMQDIPLSADMKTSFCHISDIMSSERRWSILQSFNRFPMLTARSVRFPDWSPSAIRHAPPCSCTTPGSLLDASMYAAPKRTFSFPKCELKKSPHPIPF